MQIATPQKLPLIIGHRGASREAPENTLESFRRARTVDRPSKAHRLCNLGVDSIMTNRPGWLRKKLAPRENVS